MTTSEEPGTAPLEFDRHRRSPRRTALIVLVMAAAASAAGLAATGEPGGGDDEPETAAGPSATAEVKKTTLKDTVTVDGKLSYGDIPIYRTLSPGASGSDVEILEENLKALGYHGFTADDEYTWATAEAVREWQDDLNREETGTVQPGEAVVAKGPRKVSEVRTEVGAPANGTILSWTGTERLSTVDLDAQYEDLAKVGTKAEIELPDGTTVEATITDIGAPTNASDGNAEGGRQEEDEDATLPVELEVKDQQSLGRYQAASVDVTLESKTR